MEDKQKKFFEAVKKSGSFRKELLKIIHEIDRGDFFDSAFYDKVYSLEPLLIGKGESSDDPVTLLKIIELLDLGKSSRVLEIGTGSGYSTAIISSLSREVITIEFHEELALEAKRRLSRNGYRNITFLCGDGTLYENLSELGSFDAIIILAGCVMRPLNLLECLTGNGMAVFPMGTPAQQMITLYRNIASGNVADTHDKIKFHDLCVFKSIRGCYGWEDNQALPL